MVDFFGTAVRDARQAFGSRPAPTSDVGWAQHWGDEAVRSIRAAIAHPAYTTVEDLDLNYAIRAAVLAWWHACKAKDYRYWDARFRENLKHNKDLR